MFVRAPVWEVGALRLMCFLRTSTAAGLAVNLSECIMQGDPKVIEYLNKGLRSELTAINQYWLHYRVLHNWGLLEMAKVWR